MNNDAIVYSILENTRAWGKGC